MTHGTKAIKAEQRSTLQYMPTTVRCENATFVLPQGPGLGIEPHPDVWQFVRPKDTA